MKKPNIKQFFDIEPKKLLKYYLIELGFLVLCLLVDQLTKLFIYAPIAQGAPDIILIKGVLRFTAVENTGASFGIFSNQQSFLKVLSTITVVIMMVVLVFSVKQRNPWLRSSIVMIIAGGIGNLIDRFAFDYVRDFIYFELIDFAVFNLADSCLTVGCVLLVIYVIFFYRPDDDKHKKNIKTSENDDFPRENS